MPIKSVICHAMSLLSRHRGIFHHKMRSILLQCKTLPQCLISYFWLQLLLLRQWNANQEHYMSDDVSAFKALRHFSSQNEIYLVSPQNLAITFNILFLTSTSFAETVKCQSRALYVTRCLCFQGIATFLFTKWGPSCFDAKLCWC
jgi:hypothetical protein